MFNNWINIYKKGNFYKCAASAAWVEPKKLYIKVQIIDKYFGNLGITIGFKDDVCGVYMVKHAEAFLEEYQGFAGGTLQEKKEWGYDKANIKRTIFDNNRHIYIFFGNKHIFGTK